MNDCAIIIGGASCVWTDLTSFEQMYGREWDGLVIAVNDIGAHWPRDLNHWASLHPNKFKKWKALRYNLWRTPDSATYKKMMRPYETWGSPPRFDDWEMTDHILTPWLGGSSGMFAVQVALALGCRKAILCGIPMTPTAHFSESQEEFGTSWGSADAHWRVWPRHQPQMEGWVRSMSGRTQELLGQPTWEWLYESGVCRSS